VLAGTAVLWFLGEAVVGVAVARAGVLPRLPALLLVAGALGFATFEGPFVPVLGQLAVVLFAHGAGLARRGARLDRVWLRGRAGTGRRTAGHRREDAAMSEPNQQAAGEGISDEEMVETVAEQTDSASENADVAGKDWDGDPSTAPAPEGQ
jgi:hypothetical protein